MKRGWSEELLGDVCVISPQKAIAKQEIQDTEMVSFVPMACLGELQKEFTPKEDKTLKAVYSSYTYFGDGDVIIAKITPCFENGKMGIARDLTNGIGFGSSEFVPLRVTDKLLPEYLYYFLLRDEFRSNGASVMTGAVGHKRVPKDYIEKLKIPLPPLDEQKRIVSILDQAFEGLDRARANAEANLESARELEQLQFNAAISGSFVNPTIHDESIETLLADIQRKRQVGKPSKTFPLPDGFEGSTKLREGWKWVPLGNLCSNISDGVHKTPNYVGQGVPFITVKNLTAGPGICFADTKFISEEDHKEYIKRTHPEKGDILISKDGTIGVVRQIETEKTFSIFVSVALIKPVDYKLSRYLTIALQTPAVQNLMTPKGTALKHLYISDLRSLPIPLGPLKDLEQTVTVMQGLFKQNQELFDRLKQKLHAISELRQSLLQKAFSGKLT